MSVCLSVYEHRYMTYMASHNICLKMFCYTRTVQMELKKWHKTRRVLLWTALLRTTVLKVKAKHTKQWVQNQKVIDLLFFVSLFTLTMAVLLLLAALPIASTAIAKANRAHSGSNSTGIDSEKGMAREG